MNFAEGIDLEGEEAGFVPQTPLSRSYSACVPIQNQTQSSSRLTHSERWWSPTRADYRRPKRLKRSEGCCGSAFRRAKFLSANRRTSGSSWS
jgi:hypothetical protein